jgi:dCMP deaminase
MRIGKNDYFMRIAETVSLRASCPRRKVGCVLVSYQGNILATGYNGPPRHRPHCSDGAPCNGALSKSGEGLDKCAAVHAEQNALLQCGNVEDICAVYTTTKPCVHCVKMLMNTGAKTIYYSEDYPAMDTRAIWNDDKLGRSMLHLEGGRFEQQLGL